MNKREEFFRELSTGLVHTEYTERFIQEMQDHVDDAQFTYSLSSHGDEPSEHRALRDLGNPPQLKHQFNQVMKYRKKISVIVEIILLVFFAIPIGYFSELFTNLVYGNGMLLGMIGLVAQALLIAICMTLSLRRIQNITFGEMNLIFPALALIVGFVGPAFLGIGFPYLWQVDHETMRGVFFNALGHLSGTLLGCVVGYVFARGEFFEKTALAQRWKTYRAEHALPFSPGWLLCAYPIISTILLWTGIRVDTQRAWPFNMIQAPRQFLEMILTMQLAPGDERAVVVLAGGMGIIALLLALLMVAEVRRKEKVSPIKATVVAYFLCVLFFAPPVAEEFMDGMEWSVPFQNVERTQHKKQFGLLDRFATYLEYVHPPTVYAARYGAMYDRFALYKDHPMRVVYIHDIRSVNDYVYENGEQIRIADYSEDQVFPNGFACTHTSFDPVGSFGGFDASRCAGLTYNGTELFTAPVGNFVDIVRIVTDASQQFAVMLAYDNDNEEDVDAFLLELPDAQKHK